METPLFLATLGQEQPQGIHRVTISVFPHQKINPHISSSLSQTLRVGIAGGWFVVTLDPVSSFTMWQPWLILSLFRSFSVSSPALRAVGVGLWPCVCNYTAKPTFQEKVVEAGSRMAQGLNEIFTFPQPKDCLFGHILAPTFCFVLFCFCFIWYF